MPKKKGNWQKTVPGARLKPNVPIHPIAWIFLKFCQFTGASLSSSRITQLRLSFLSLFLLCFVLYWKFDCMHIYFQVFWTCSTSTFARAPAKMSKKVIVQRYQWSTSSLPHIEGRHRSLTCSGSPRHLCWHPTFFGSLLKIRTSKPTRYVLREVSQNLLKQTVPEPFRKTWRVKCTF